MCPLCVHLQSEPPGVRANAQGRLDVGKEAYLLPVDDPLHRCRVAGWKPLTRCLTSAISSPRSSSSASRNRLSMWCSAAFCSSRSWWWRCKSSDKSNSPSDGRGPLLIQAVEPMDNPVSEHTPGTHLPVCATTGTGARPPGQRSLPTLGGNGHPELARTSPPAQLVTRPAPSGRLAE